MRYIYLDESGTSGARHESVRVVAGIVMLPDEHYRRVEIALKCTMSQVPERYRKGFIFHAADINNADKYDKEWLMDDRRQLITDVMGIPLAAGAAVTCGAVRSNEVTAQYCPPDMKNFQFKHMMAFRNCVAEADEYIRIYGGKDEIASLVCEDEPHMKKWLKLTLDKLRSHIIVQNLQGQLVVDDVELQFPHRVTHVNRVRDSIFFQAKSESPLLQIADACAWGVRRFFRGEPYGDVYFNAISGLDSSTYPQDWVSMQNSFFSHVRRDPQYPVSTV